MEKKMLSELNRRSIVAQIPKTKVSRNSSHIFFQNLPTPLTPLFGREQEIQVVRTRLLRPEVRLLTLIGMPGIGKTRLALAFAAQMQDIFTDGICFVSLSSINKPEQVIPTIAHTFGPFNQEKGPVMEQVKAFLHTKHFLLLLDTFDQVLPAGPLLVELLEACPHLKLVVTSRSALHVQGEYEFSVLPLAIPDQHKLPSCNILAQVPSVALFVERAEAIKPGLTVTEHNAALIAKICIQLEGVPLAIELAATRSKLLSLQELSSLLERGLEILSGVEQYRPLHQQSLYHAIHWSYDLLSPDEQVLFRRLCIFQEDFTLADAAAVATAPGTLSISLLDGITSLLNKSFLQQHEEDEQHRYLYLFRMIREYGLKRLAESQELEQCQKAYTAYCHLSAQTHEAFYTTEQKTLTLEDNQHIQMILETLFKQGEMEFALHLASALRHFWLFHGQSIPGQAFLEQVIEDSWQDIRKKMNCTPIKALSRAGYRGPTTKTIRSLYGYTISPGKEQLAYEHTLPEAHHKLDEKTLATTWTRKQDTLSRQKKRALTGSPSPEIHLENRESLPAQDVSATLTPREIEVLRLLATGLSNNQIAKQLVLSTFTVNRHAQSIYGKLGVNSRSAATRFAMDHQLL
jgi:predicted ATPase/DNA-binding CsgD family transcriptional regulator